MPVSDELKALVDQMPDPDGKGMYTQNIDKNRIERAVAALHAGGRDNVVGLIEMLGDPGSDEDAKPHYALHCLANHALQIKDEAARKMISETLSAELSAEHSKYVKRFLCQELQWLGHKEATPALGNLLLDEDLVEPATMALVAIREGAAVQLRVALPLARGKCRLNIVQGLGSVEDRQSTAALEELLNDEGPEVRMAAGWALARIGDPDSVSALIKAADADPGWERIQATKHCLMMAEKLSAAGQTDPSTEIYTYLRDTRTDPSEGYVREAAEKALESA